MVMLGIKEDAVLLDMLPTGIVPTKLPITSEPSSPQGTSPEKQTIKDLPPNGAGPKLTRKRPYRYNPADEEHQILAIVVRHQGVEASSMKVLEYIDEHGEMYIDTLAPDYCASLPKEARRSLVKATSTDRGLKDRIEKVIRDVRKALRNELARNERS